MSEYRPWKTMRSCLPSANVSFHRAHDPWGKVFWQIWQILTIDCQFWVGNVNLLALLSFNHQRKKWKGTTQRPQRETLNRIVPFLNTQLHPSQSSYRVLGEETRWYPDCNLPGQSMVLSKLIVFFSVSSTFATVFSLSPVLSPTPQADLGSSQLICCHPHGCLVRTGNQWQLVLVSSSGLHCDLNRVDWVKRFCGGLSRFCRILSDQSAQANGNPCVKLYV